MARFLLVALLIVGFASELQGQEKKPPEYLQSQIRQRYLELVEKQSADWTEAKLQDEISRLQQPQDAPTREPDINLKQRLADDLVLLLQDDVRYLNVFVEQHEGTEAAFFASSVSKTLARTLEFAKAYGEGRLTVEESGGRMIYQGYGKGN